jgi:hypothetical protein
MLLPSGDALVPWMDTLFDALLKYFPLPPGALAHSTPSIPPSRVTLARSDAVANKSSVDLRPKRRITYANSDFSESYD